jgi:hypothetical protein
MPIILGFKEICFCPVDNFTIIRFIRTSFLMARALSNSLIDETGPLERLFSSRATTRIIDFLVTFREFDYPLTEIAENTGVNRRTVERVMPNLIHYGVVKVTRTVGRSKMYQCNTGSPLVKGVINVSSEISDHDVAGLLKEEPRMEDRKVERAVPDS